MFSSYPIIFAMILSVRPRSALIEKLVTFPKQFPTRSSGDLRDISQRGHNVETSGLAHPAGDVPAVQSRVVGENLVIVSVAVLVNCSSCIFMA